VTLPRPAAELLAVGVGPGEPAVVGAVTLRGARDEKGHRLRRRLLSAALPGRLLLPGVNENDRRRGEQGSRGCREDRVLLHRCLSPWLIAERA
jgi:hypothetical protein